VPGRAGCGRKKGEEGKKRRKGRKKKEEKKKEKGEGKERKEKGKKRKGRKIKKREGKIGEGILEKSGKLLGKIGKGFAGVFPVSGYQRVFRASAYFLGRR
jgi:hypothetical protein